VGAPNMPNEEMNNNIQVHEAHTMTPMDTFLNMCEKTLSMARLLYKMYPSADTGLLENVLGTNERALTSRSYSQWHSNPQDCRE
jgi:hypothetical protein